jgi:hypothetical protein
MRPTLSRLGFLIILALVIGATGELTARVEDFLRRGVPIQATPDRYRDLVLHDALGIRGRPYGHFGRWQLNSVGFRGPEITRQPSPGCHRVLILGASETFGLYESDGKEYPAQLQTKLSDARTGCYEVVNASLFGLTLPGITQLWENWGRQFAPRTVVIYPTPAFYLAEHAPKRPGPPPTHVDAAPWWTPRLRGRAEDVIDFPAFIQRRRIARDAAALEAEHDRSWFYESVPPERLELFARDLETLVAAIQSSSATPLLVTHATGFHRPPDDDDLQIDAMEAWRLHMRKPRAPVLLAFEDQAREATIALARRRGVPVVDAAAIMNGREPWFAGDLLHFGDAGAGRLADLLAVRLVAPVSTRADAAEPTVPAASPPGSSK